MRKASWINITRNLFLFFITLQPYKNLLALEISDEQYMDYLEIKMKERASNIKILRNLGPEAYFRARKDKMSEEDKEALRPDLVKIMEMKEAPKAYVDRKKKLLVIEDEQGRSEYKVEDLKKGYFQNYKGEKYFFLNKKYAEIRKNI